MKKLVWGFLAWVLFASSARAALLSEVFLSDGPDGDTYDVPDAVEIDQINTHSELTLLVLDARDSGSWGSVVDGFTLIRSKLDGGDTRVLISDGEFPSNYGAIADSTGSLPIVDISAPGSPAVTKLTDPSTAYTDGLDLGNARVLVLLGEGLSQAVVNSTLDRDAFDTQGNTLSLSNGTTVEMLDWWGFDGQPELLAGTATLPGLDLDGNELVDVRGSSVLIRDPEAPTFVHGNSDGDGHLEGFSPRLRITPGASNPFFVPEPVPAGLIALGVSVVLGSRRCTRLAVR